ncbi:MAG TPA: hypothetical protein VKY85_08785 [Candidatus Angelobacter sp.]|nr:hypothetical protein [Candidatus Angelobacter sp.]
MTKALALPPPLNERILKIFRILAAIGTGFTTILALSQNSYVHAVLHNVQLPSLNTTIRWELGLQGLTVFCLLGFALQTLPAVREDRWFERTDDPAVAKIFGAMEAEERQQRLRNTMTAATQFRGCWIFLWATWVVLYAVWWASPPSQTQAINIFTVVGDTLNMLTGSAFFLCYYVMTRHTAPPPKVGFLTLAFFTTAGFMLIGLVGLLYQGQPPPVLDPFHWLSGLVSGIAMALFVGRLESGLMRITPILIVAYYAYAIIQFSYPALPKEPWVFLVMTSFALVLKILLFWELRKILSDGTIYWYMLEYRKDLEVGKDDKQQFLAAFLVKDKVVGANRTLGQAAS